MIRPCGCGPTTSLFDLCRACAERVSIEADDASKRDRESPEKKLGKEVDLSTAGARLRPGS